MPTKVSMDTGTTPATCPAAYVVCYQYKVKWSEANPAGVKISVYAVTRCLGKPHCVGTGVSITSADLKLLGTAAASAGSMTFICGGGESPGAGWLKVGTKTVYIYGVIVEASNTTGKSIAAIAYSA
jgi:hypothetical protein